MRREHNASTARSRPSIPGTRSSCERRVRESCDCFVQLTANSDHTIFWLDEETEAPSSTATPGCVGLSDSRGLDVGQPVVVRDGHSQEWLCYQTESSRRTGRSICTGPLNFTELDALTFPPLSRRLSLRIAIPADQNSSARHLAAENHCVEIRTAGH